MTEFDELASRLAMLNESVDRVLGEVREQRAQLNRLALCYGMDLAWDGRLRDSTRSFEVPELDAHVQRAVANAEMHTDPFPHLVIETLLPIEAFRTLREAVPPEQFFAGEPHLDLKGIGQPGTIMPASSRVVWNAAHRMIGRTLAPSLVERFRPFTREFLRKSMGDEVVEAATALPLMPRGLRLMLRRPGWELAPHLDPRHQFITTLLYLGGPGEPESYGTQLFRVREDFLPTKANTFYPEEEGLHCELVKTLPYRGNVCLSFLNLGGGAHGATLPADAQPPGMKRLVSQFYIGPPNDQLSPLIDRLPPERQAAWRQRIKKKDLRAARRMAAAAAPEREE